MEKYKFFLEDLVALLKEQLEQASKDSSIDSFKSGKTMGIYVSLDLIKSQAIAFEIPLDEIGLNEYDLERFL